MFAQVTTKVQQVYSAQKDTVKVQQASQVQKRYIKDSVAGALITPGRWFVADLRQLPVPASFDLFDSKVKEILRLNFGFNIRSGQRSPWQDHFP